jgi:hypothetical protein
MKKNQYKSVIVLKLPDGINYYCGKTKFEGHFVDTWNTEIEQAILYLDKTVAKKRCSILKKSRGQNNCKVKDFYRLPIEQQQKRNFFINSNLKIVNHGNSTSTTDTKI